MKPILPVREMPEPEDKPAWTIPEKEIIFMELRSIREAVVEIAARLALESEKEKN